MILRLARVVNNWLIVALVAATGMARIPICDIWCEGA
jgi:hypothetical protein